METDASKRGWGGALVEIGVQHAHQLPKSIGSLPGDQVFFTRDCRSVIILLRMDNMSAITCEQAWGHNFTKFDSHNQTLGSGACRTPTGSTERDHRQGIACDE